MYGNEIVITQKPFELNIHNYTHNYTTNIKIRRKYQKKNSLNIIRHLVQYSFSRFLFFSFKLCQSCSQKKTNNIN